VDEEEVAKACFSEIFGNRLPPNFLKKQIFLSFQKRKTCVFWSSLSDAKNAYVRKGLRRAVRRFIVQAKGHSNEELIWQHAKGCKPQKKADNTKKEEMTALMLAWVLEKHVKSNAMLLYHETDLRWGQVNASS